MVETLVRVPGVVQPKQGDREEKVVRLKI